MLRRGGEHLIGRARTRPVAALELGDPDAEVTVACACVQQLRAVYHALSPAEGRHRASDVLASFATCPISEIVRLGRTLRSWRTEFLAYFDTGANNGPTEAINLLVEKTRRIGHGYRNFDN